MMYCVIQKIQNKKQNAYGTDKEILVDQYDWSIDGKPGACTYRYSDERFERPIKDAYKISIHKSYRESGKVKKKQWSICTIGYYELFDFSLYDCINTSRLKEKLEQMEIDEDTLFKMIYEKLGPIIEQIETEFKQTDEYKAKQEQKRILDEYNKAKAEFDKVYGEREYDRCYDVFGTLRNPDYLDQLKAQRKAKEESERSYYDNFYSNYKNNYDYSTLSGITETKYTDEEKAILKKIYRAAAKKLHPDVTKDDGKAMKFLTKLKDEWGI